MKFNIVTSKIKIRELIELEKTPSLSQTVDMMSRFMVDETTGDPIPQAEAYEQLCDLSAEEIQAVQVSFMESFSPNQKSARR